MYICRETNYKQIRFRNGIKEIFLLRNRFIYPEKTLEHASCLSSFRRVHLDDWTVSRLIYI